jgi:uncharacterized membrane protein
MSLLCRFFTISLPIVWTLLSAANFCYPGDEYALWGTTSFAGTWILWIMPSFSSGQHPRDILPVVLIAGFATMTVLGYLLDRLRAPRIPFVVTWLIAATLFIISALNQYPSYQDAMSKNGSLQAYVLSLANFTLTATGLLFLVISAAWTLFRKFRDPAMRAAPQNSNG